MAYAVVLLSAAGLWWGLHVAVSASERRMPRSLRLRVPAVAREAWESEGEDWRGEDPGDAASYDGVFRPRSFFDEQRRRFLERERLGAVACPKCTARNDLRKLRGLAVLPGHITIRRRDLALFCRVCDEIFYRCSDDTILRVLLPPAEDQ